jgi:hypothetical protein
VREIIPARARLVDTFAEAINALKLSRRLLDGGKTIAALARVLPWGLGEAATALEFFVECLQ